MKMKVSKRDLSILLIVLGLIAAFCVYQFYFRGAMNDKKAYEDESKELQARLNKLNNVDESAFIADMAKRSEELKEKAAKYPANYLYEDLIMYLNNWQELPYDEIYGEIYNFPAYKIEETQMQDVIGGVIDWDQTNRAPIQASCLVGQASIEANYETNGYKAFKDMINKIYLDPLPKTIRKVTATMRKDNGFVVGSLIVDLYNANTLDGTNVYTPVEITGVDKGVENVFGPTYTPTPTPTPTINPRMTVRPNEPDEE